MPVGLGGHQDGQENHETRLQRLREEISYWRARAGQVAEQLDQLMPGSTTARDPVVVRRLHVDHGTAIELAEEAEAQLARLTGNDQAGPVDVDEPGLF